jgi:hypothetical protein
LVSLIFRRITSPGAEIRQTFSQLQICRLYLSMMDKMKVRLPKFGDASKATEEI